MAKTLIQFATARRAAARAGRDAAAAAFADARRAVDGDPADPETTPGLRRTRDRLAREAAELGSRLADARRELAGDLTPAELAARVEAVRALIVELNGRLQEQLAAEEELALAERRLGAAGERLRRATAELTAADAELAAKSDRAARLQDRADSLAEAPLVDLTDRAQAAMDQAPDDEAFVEARQRVEGDIPEALRLRAVERYRAERARSEAGTAAVAAAEGVLAGRRRADQGPAAGVAAAAAGLAAAEEALADFAARGPGRLAAARGLLAQVTAARALTDAERAAIAEPQRVTDGEAAAALESARDLARGELAANQAELEARRLAVLADDVDADPAADPEVQTLQGEVDDLQDALAAAEAAYTAADRAALDDWEAAVPAAAWDALLAFERARESLTALAAAQPAARLQAVVDAEDALVTALEAAAESRRTLDALAGEVQSRRHQVEAAASVRDRRFAAAVRGDRS
jgi:SWI/SNF-related matrix-associated actin-dependent regulator 1 of chromatin subfamily A